MRKFQLMALIIGCGGKDDATEPDTGDKDTQPAELCSDGSIGNLDEGDVEHAVFINPNATTSGDGSLEEPFMMFDEAHAAVIADDDTYIIFVAPGTLHAQLIFSASDFPEDSYQHVTFMGCGPEETTITWDEQPDTTQVLLWSYHMSLAVQDIALVGGGEATVYYTGAEGFTMYNVRISHDTMTDGDVGVWIDSGDATLDAVEISGLDTGIYATGRGAVTIANVNINDGHIGIWGDSIDELTITDPTIHDLTYRGIALGGFSVDVNISGGTIGNVVYAGIWAHGVYNLTVEDISITGVSDPDGEVGTSALADGIRAFQRPEETYNPAGFTTEISNISIGDAGRFGILVSGASLTGLTNVSATSTETRVAADGNGDVSVVLQDRYVVKPSVSPSDYSVNVGDDLFPVE